MDVLFSFIFFNFWLTPTVPAVFFQLPSVYHFIPQKIWENLPKKSSQKTNIPDSFLRKFSAGSTCPSVHPWPPGPAAGRIKGNFFREFLTTRTCCRDFPSLHCSTPPPVNLWWRFLHLLLQLLFWVFSPLSPPSSSSNSALVFLPPPSWCFHSSLCFVSPHLPQTISSSCPLFPPSCGPDFPPSPSSLL